MRLRFYSRPAFESIGRAEKGGKQPSLNGRGFLGFDSPASTMEKENVLKKKRGRPPKNGEKMVTICVSVTPNQAEMLPKRDRSHTVRLALEAGGYPQHKPWPGKSGEREPSFVPWDGKEEPDFEVPAPDPMK